MPCLQLRPGFGCWHDRSGFSGHQFTHAGLGSSIHCAGYGRQRFIHWLDRLVAICTSLPELASLITAARKGEHDLALGNVIGSNLFNTLAVVGLAGAIQPMSIPTEIIYRVLATPYI